MPIAALTDGTSNTLLTGEVLVGQGFDLRGWSWWGYGSTFTAWLSPNSTSPDVLWSSGYCGSVPPNIPCVGSSGTASSSGGIYTGRGMTSALRSKHPGGVNVGMADGSVRFIKNSVNLYTWRRSPPPRATKSSAPIPTDVMFRISPSERETRG